MANLPQWLRDIDALLVAELAPDWETSRTNGEAFAWMKTPEASSGRVPIEAINSYLYDNALLEPLMAVEDTNTKAAALARMLESEAASDIDNGAWSTFVEGLPAALDGHKAALKGLGDTTSTTVARIPSVNQLESMRIWAQDGRPDASPTEG